MCVRTPLSRIQSIKLSIIPRRSSQQYVDPLLVVPKDDLTSPLYAFAVLGCDLLTSAQCPRAVPTRVVLLGFFSSLDSIEQFAPSSSSTTSQRILIERFDLRSLCNETTFIDALRNLRHSQRMKCACSACANERASLLLTTSNKHYDIIDDNDDIADEADDELARLASALLNMTVV